MIKNSALVFVDRDNGHSSRSQEVLEAMDDAFGWLYDDNDDGKRYKCGTTITNFVATKVPLDAYASSLQEQLDCEFDEYMDMTEGLEVLLCSY